MGVIAAFAFSVDILDAARVGAAFDVLAVFPAALVLAGGVDAGVRTARGLLRLLGGLRELPATAFITRRRVIFDFVGAPRDAVHGVVQAKGAH